MDQLISSQSTFAVEDAINSKEQEKTAVGNSSMVHLLLKQLTMPFATAQYRDQIMDGRYLKFVRPTSSPRLTRITLTTNKMIPRLLRAASKHCQVNCKYTFTTKGDGGIQRTDH